MIGETSLHSPAVDVDDQVANTEWLRVQQWLEMTAGLQFVDVERH